MNSFTLVRRIAARPSIVFEALTTADGLAAWWGPDDGPVTLSEVDARLGGAFRVRFRTDDGTEHEASGEFLELTPPRRVVMSWRWTMNGDSDERGRTSRIEIDVAPTIEGVELTFTHADLVSAESALGHQDGWSGSLDKLVRHLAAA
jgi:uncharacterized protein YndB with AHSA1/START domain